MLSLEVEYFTATRLFLLMFLLAGYKTNFIYKFMGNMLYMCVYQYV